MQNLKFEATRGHSSSHTQTLRIGTTDNGTLVTTDTTTKHRHKHRHCTMQTNNNTDTRTKSHPRCPKTNAPLKCTLLLPHSTIAKWQRRQRDTCTNRQQSKIETWHTTKHRQCECNDNCDTATTWKRKPQFTKIANNKLRQNVIHAKNEMHQFPYSPYND